MNQSTSNFRFTSNWAAIFLAAALAAIHLAIQGSAFYQTSAANQLAQDLVVIEGNLEEISAITEETLAGLRQQLADSEARLAHLRSTVPELGAPYQVYHRTFELAEATGVQLVSVTHEGTQTAELAIGAVQVDVYYIRALGTMEACLDLIGRLEETGLGTVAVENLELNGGAAACSFDILTVGSALQEGP